MDPQVFVQALITAVMLAGIYGLTAIGITLIFSVMGIINFAYGAALMLGAFVTYLATGSLGLPYIVGVLLAGLVVGVSSMALEGVLFRPLRNEPNATLLMTFALSLFLEGSALVVFGAAWRNVELPVSGSWIVFGVAFIKTRVLILVGCTIAIGLLFAFLRWTMPGYAMRAIAQDQEGAALQGIPIDRTFMVGFGIGSGLGAFAGGLLALLTAVEPSMGTPWLLKAFIVIILGGLGNVRGAVAGAILLAFIDTFGTYLVGSGVQLVGYILVVTILMFRPAGVLSRA